MLSFAGSRFVRFNWPGQTAQGLSRKGLKSAIAAISETTSNQPRICQNMGENQNILRQKMMSLTKAILGCPWNLVTLVSKLGYNLFRGLTTYLYWGYNPVTKYHGHPSSFFAICKQKSCLKFELNLCIVKKNKHVMTSGMETFLGGILCVFAP